MERYNRGAGAASAPTPPSAPANPYFTEGNPSLGVPATQPGPWWFHMITEEMRKVITDAGLTPDHTDLTQLSAAIQAMITASLAPGASETVKGLIEIATAAEVLAGTDTERAVTPAGLLSGLLGPGGGSASDYITIPYRDKTNGSRKNLIIQWGAANVSNTGTTVTFPIAFPTACRNVMMTDREASGTVQYVCAVQGTPTAVSFVGQSSYSGANTVFWLAIGN